MNKANIPGSRGDCGRRRRAAVGAKPRIRLRAAPGSAAYLVARGSKQAAWQAARKARRGRPPGARQRQLARLCRRYGVSVCYLFGSQRQSGYRLLCGREARAARGSDLDVGVVFQEFFPEENRKHHRQLRAALNRLLAPFSVHLIYLEEERCQLQFEVLRQGIVAFRCCRQCVEAYRSRVLTGWGDWYNWWPL